MIDVKSLVSLLMTAAVIAFIGGGLALIVQARALAAKALLSGVALAIVAGIGPGALASVGTVPPLTLLIGATALIGIVMLVKGRAKLALSLLWPALSNWALWPVLWPYLQADWPLLIIMLAPFTLFILIWLLQRALRPIYGERVADHVAGTYVVRTLDASGRGLGWLIAAPVRIVRGAFSGR